MTDYPSLNGNMAANLLEVIKWVDGRMERSEMGFRTALNDAVTHLEATDARTWAGHDRKHQEQMATIETRLSPLWSAFQAETRAELIRDARFGPIVRGARWVARNWRPLLSAFALLSGMLGIALIDDWLR